MPAAARPIVCWLLDNSDARRFILQASGIPVGHPRTRLVRSGAGNGERLLGNYAPGSFSLCRCFRLVTRPSTTPRATPTPTPSGMLCIATPMPVPMATPMAIPRAIAFALLFPLALPEPDGSLMVTSRYEQVVYASAGAESNGGATSTNPAGWLPPLAIDLQIAILNGLC